MTKKLIEHLELARNAVRNAPGLSCFEQNHQWGYYKENDWVQIDCDDCKMRIMSMSADAFNKLVAGSKGS